MSKSPNQLAIIKELSSRPSKSAPYGELRETMNNNYIPMRRRLGGKLKRTPHPNMFSGWIESLRKSGLVEVGYLSGSNKKKLVTLTDDGAFLAKFSKASRIDAVSLKE